ncbi:MULTISPECIES: PepSY domain-containing protein [Halobacteriovorax]|uniref:PepSY domain-containing protein n=1 Tax=Halobacteriovorax vibrionivorans TaxID=2152716 RepID=A0ABY0IGG8_9BACT|nr:MULTISPECIES: PepSY domain-containing protein [Halobacteriovorax]AYF43793.1 hypothetical protein BALOs_0783 [Halobacteriovorax sp. BALOs_7]RZF21675.1 PepSY domain-containing protein [Halobacteriovorax vibrionivorans]TGD49033.1 PepSY domain-containing protein [Halobacteriovorax sp. Y22]
MKKIFVMVLLGMTFVSCSKKTQCTTEDKSKWQDQETFKSNLVSQGYKINEFKVTEGNCYEIYGWDKDKNKVEIYFNPVDGSIVKKENH